MKMRLKIFTSGFRQLFGKSHKFFFCCIAGRNQTTVIGKMNKTKNHPFLHIKMATARQKSQCVLWFNETKSATVVQRRFLPQFGRPAPNVKTIKNWYEKFTETGSVGDRGRTGRPRVDRHIVEEVQQAFERNPSKSVRKSSSELGIPKSTVQKILRKRLNFFPYKLRVVHALNPGDQQLRVAFAEEILRRIDEEDKGYL